MDFAACTSLYKFIYIYISLSVFFGPEDDQYMGLIWPTTRFPVSERSEIESLASQEEKSSRLRSRKDAEVPFDVDSNAPWMPIGFLPLSQDATCK